MTREREGWNGWVLGLLTGFCLGVLAAYVVTLVATPSAAPSEGPDASVTWKGYTDVPVLRGAPLAPPSLPVVAVRPQPSRARESAPVTLRGFATWCGPTPTQCQQWGGDAMLGAVPSFRDGDEPYMARVSRGQQSVVVKVVSFCACGDRHGVPTLIDLSPRAFEQLAPLSRGVVRVEVEALP